MSHRVFSALLVSSSSLARFRPISIRILNHRNMSTELDAARASVVEQVKFDALTKTQQEDNDKTRKSIARCFATDTVTAPTPEMFAYASLASLGDAVFHEPSTLALEAHVAQLVGKEAAAFIPSGTMSNQLALRTHLKQPPYSVLCDHRAHIHNYEAGGTAFHSGATTIPVVPSNGHHLTLKDVQEHIVVGDDIHLAPTEVVELENTLNGTIIPQDEVIAISDWVHSKGVKMHLDGARLWHVAIETGIPLKELCAPFDSVSLCFSKGLGAPIGSILVGSEAYIKKARWFRKLFGGGMRQTGYLAASAAFALTHNFPKLLDVHALTRKLEAGLQEAGVRITSPAETCMVFFDPSPIGVEYSEIIEKAARLPEPIILYGSRLVVHIQTSPAAVDDLVSLIKQLAQEKKEAGFVYTPPANGHSGNIYVRNVKKN
ncbi:threonine aldolase family protein [Abortiporus biennis]